MKTVWAVIDGMVTAILAFEQKADAEQWAQENQQGGEAFVYNVQSVNVYPDLESAPKKPLGF